VPDAVSLRPARGDDGDRLLKWRNEPAVRAASRSTQAITPAEHADWFARRLADPNTRIFIVEYEGEAAGQVRVDRLDSDRGEIHIALAAEVRGRGLAAEALRAAARLGTDELRLARIEANVRAGNEPSLRAFARAGFTEVRRDGDWIVLEYPRAPMADPILSAETVAAEDERYRRGYEAHLHAETQTREYRAIVDTIAADGPARVLDWGCGYGQISHMLKQRGLAVTSFEYRGPDAPDAELPLGHYPDINAYISSEPVALPYEDASFDAVLSCGVLEHTGNQEANLDEVARVLKPGGRFHVYKLPNRFSYLEWIARRMGLHYHGSEPGDMLFTVAQTRDMFARHGYEVEWIRRANMLPLTVAAVQRIAPLWWALNRALSRVPVLNLLATNVELVARRPGTS
jgi:RimJ/RimL family protein N-acetyltransferase/ubiquinone/menaquinone biosynthesis C-methylase UbiE